MNFIDAYKDLFGTRRFTSRSAITPGTVVQFTYDGEQKYALVLDPEWNGKMHALSLKTLSVDGLKSLLDEVKTMTSREEIYAKYKESQYTEDRPYRTYTISKMSAIRQIYLKAQQTKIVPTKPIEAEVVKETYGMYGDNV